MRALLFALVALLATPAHAAFDVGDLVCETSTTTGTGTLNLAGAVSNYVTFVSQIASGNTVPYHIRASDGKLEVGIGTFTDATPDTLTRTADWSTDGSGAELTLPAGTHTVCLGPISGSITHNPMTEDLDINGFEITNAAPDTLDGANITVHIDDGADARFSALGVNTSAGQFGPFFATYHNSASPEDDDEIGGFSFYSNDDGPASMQMANFSVVVTDVSDTTTDSRFKIATRVNDVFASSFEAGAGVYIGALGANTMPGTGNLGFGDGAGIDNAEGTAMLGFQNDAGGGIIDVYDDMVPDSNNAYDFGTEALSWRNAYLDGFIHLTEVADPTAPSANGGRLYVRDNGSGKSQLVIRFPSGSVQVITTEP